MDFESKNSPGLVHRFCRTVSRGCLFLLCWSALAAGGAEPNTEYRPARDKRIEKEARKWVRAIHDESSGPRLGQRILEWAVKRGGRIEKAATEMSSRFGGSMNPEEKLRSLGWRAWPVLTNALQSDPDPGVRNTMINLITEFADPKVPPLLLAVHGSEADPAVREHILDALLELGSTNALAILGRGIEDGPPGEGSVALVERTSWMLGRDATAWMIDRLDTSAWRNDFGSLLERLTSKDDPRVAPAMLRFLERSADDPNVWANAKASAFQYLCTWPIPGSASRLEAIRRRIEGTELEVSALAALELAGGEPDVALLRAWFRAPGRDRSRTRFEPMNRCLALSEFPGSMATAVLTDNLLNHGDEGLREMIARELLWRSSTFPEVTRVRTALVQVLQGNSGSKLRAVCAEALGKVGDQESIDALLECIRKEEDESVMQSALWALLPHRNPGITQAMEARLSGSDPSEERSARLADFLDSSATPETRRLMIQWLRGNSSRLASSAAKALGEIGETAAGADLIHALRSHADESVRGAAAISIGKLKPIGAREALVAALRDPEQEVQVRAIEALGLLGDTAATPVLLRALKEPSTSENNLIEQHTEACKALVLIGGAKAVQGLIEAGVDDPEALFALTRLDLKDCAGALVKTYQAATVHRPPLRWLIACVGAPEARALVREALFEGVALRRAAVRTAAGMSGLDRVTLDRLAELSRLESSPAARAGALRALALADPEGAVAAAKDAMRDRENSVVAEAITLAGFLGTPALVPEVRSFLRHPASLLRTKAIFSLAQLERTNAVPEFLVALGDGEPVVRVGAAVALEYLGRPEGIELVRAEIRRDRVGLGPIAFLGLFDTELVRAGLTAGNSEVSTDLSNLAGIAREKGRATAMVELIPPTTDSSEFETEWSLLFVCGTRSEPLPVRGHQFFGDDSMAAWALSMGRDSAVLPALRKVAGDPQFRVRSLASLAIRSLERNASAARRN